MSNNYNEYESADDKNKALSIDEYLNNNIRPYLTNMISDLKTRGERKIELSIAINFWSFKYINEMCAMHSKSNNMEIINGNKTDEII